MLNIRIIGSEVKYVHFQSTSILDFRLKTDLHSKEPVHELVCRLHNARCTMHIQAYLEERCNLQRHAQF